MPQSSRSSHRRGKGGPSSEIAYSHSKVLKIPRESSSPSSWARFCRDSSVLVLGGYSVATAIGEDISASLSSAYQLAETLFTPTEREMYSSWKRGKSPPRCDWRRLYTQLTENTSAQRARWNSLTDALRVLYDDQKLSRENCKAWAEKYSDLMPLLSACKKVEQARMDARPAKSTSSSKVKYDVHEIIACRKIISEIGKQRVRSNTESKAVNKEINEREEELTKRINRMNLDEPRDREAVISKFNARESYYSKLTKIRIERAERVAEIARQNSEIDSAELALKERIAILDERMKRLK